MSESMEVSVPLPLVSDTAGGSHPAGCRARPRIIHRSSVGDIDAIRGTDLDVEVDAQTRRLKLHPGRQRRCFRPPCGPRSRPAEPSRVGVSDHVRFGPDRSRRG